MEFTCIECETLYDDTDGERKLWEHYQNTLIGEIAHLLDKRLNIPKNDDFLSSSSYKESLYAGSEFFWKEYARLNGQYYMDEYTKAYKYLESMCQYNYNGKEI